MEKLLDHERQKDQTVREEEKAALDAFQQVSCSSQLAALPLIGTGFKKAGWECRV